MSLHLILQQMNLLELYGQEQIKIVNKTDLRLNVKSSKGTVYVDNETLKYQYNQENGNFTSSYDEDQIKGQVTKTTMTFIVGDDDEQITLNLNKK